MKTFLLSFLLCTAFGASAQTVSGKLPFQKGQKFEVVTTSSSSMEMMMGESKTKSVSTEWFEVKDVASSSAALEHLIKRLQIDLSIMGQEKSLDTDKPNDLEGPMGEGVKGLLNNKREFSVDATGTVTSVKNDGKKGAPDAGAMALFMQQSNASSGVPQVGLPSVFKVLPAKPVAKGDTWVDSASAEGNSMRTTYTVADLTDSEVLLTLTGAGTVNSKQEMMGMAVTVKGTISTTGTVTVDRATGFFKEKKIDTQLNTVGVVNGQEIPNAAKITAVTTLRLL